MKPQAITVLITEDDEQNQDFLFQLVRAALPTANITTANDGETAIQMVTDKIDRTHSAFDIIFMDFKMPGINGQQTTLAIRQLEEKKALKNKSVIITWSSAKESPYLQADDWLPKFT